MGADDELLRKVRARFQAAAAARAGQEAAWIERYKQYLSVRDLDPKKTKNNQAQLFVPYSFVQVETVWPRLIRGLLGPRPWFSVKALREEDDQKALVMHGLLDYQLAERMKFDLHAALWLKNALIYRFAPGRVIWRYEFRTTRRWQRTTDQETGLPALQPVEETVSVYDDPWFEVLDPWHVYVAPGTGHDIQRAQWVIHRRYLAPADFKAEAARAKYGNVDDALSKCTTKRRAGTERMAAVGLDAGDERVDELVVVDELWGPDRRIVTAGENQDYLLLEGASPYFHGRIPYLNACVFPLANELGGPSLLDAVADLQQELNDLRSLRLDDLKLSIYRMLRVEPTAAGTLTEEDLRWRPNGVIWASKDDMQPLDNPRTPTALFAEEAVIKKDIEATAGAYQYVRGEAPEREEKATTVVTMQKEAAQRFFAMCFVLEALAFKPVAEMVAALNQQFITRDRAVRLFGDEARTLRITPEQLWGDFSFSLANTAVEPEAGRDADRARWMDLYKLLRGDERVNQTELLKSLLKTFDIRDAGRLIAPAPAPAGPAPGTPGGPGQLPAMPGGVTPGPGAGAATAGPVGGPTLPPELLQLLVPGGGAPA